MPTENRSSNTEMVRVPRELTREMLNGVCMHPDIARSLWSALLKNAPQPAPQPHPEPIAWMVGTAIWWTKEEAERDAAETGLRMTPVGPLTGSAAVEQLREVIKHSDSNIQRQSLRISNQRAKLAERDALLRDNSGKLIRMAAHLISAPLFALQDLQDDDKKMTRARVDAAVDSADARLKDAAYEIRRIADALSASAEPSAQKDWCSTMERPKSQCGCPDCGSSIVQMGEPSAPVERDENADFEKWARSRITPLNLELDEIGLYHDLAAGTAHDAWQARAALERKPS